MENEKKYCSNCGAELELDSQFCGSCGAKVEEVAASETAVEKKEELASESEEVNAVETSEVEESSLKEETEDDKEIVKEESIASEKSFCANCGTEMEKGSHFCPNCGAKDGVPPEKTQVDAATTNQNNISKEKKPIDKKKLGIVGAVAGVIIVGGGIFFYVNSLPKSILADTKVTFSGYNKMGEAEIKGDYQKKEFQIIGHKVGFNDKEIKSIEKGNYSSVLTDTPKWKDLVKYYQDVSINLNKNDDLSNGDKVTLSVKTHLKDNPVKSEKKTYTVKGLEKTTTYTIDDILKEKPVTFTGYNHFGSTKYSENVWSVDDGSDDSSSDDYSYNDSSDTPQLSNGDQVKVELSKDYIDGLKDKGKLLKGTDEKTLKVANLPDSPKIDNLKDLLNQEDTVVRADNKSTKGDFGTTYTITRLDSYFIGTNINDGWSNSSDSSDGEFSIVTFYKVVSHWNNDDNNDNDETNYYTYGYTGLKLSSNKVNISSLGDDNKYNGSSDDSEQGAVDSLKSDYPSAVKLSY